jgi:hypothetical protein
MLGCDKLDGLTDEQGESVARRTNYGFEKRQRELKKQKKKEAKAERRRLRKEELDAETPGDDLGERLDASADGAEGEQEVV